MRKSLGLWTMSFARFTKTIVVLNTIAIVGLGLWDLMAFNGAISEMTPLTSASFALLNYPSWWVAIRVAGFFDGYSIVGYIATKHLVWATLAVPQWLLYFL